MPLTAPQRMRAALAAHPIRREIAFGLGAWLVFLAVALIYTWPVGKHLTSVIFGYPGDSTGTIALFGYRDDLGVGPLSTATTTLENFPVGLQLPGASALPQVAIEWPLQLLSSITGQPTLAYNVGILAGLTLTPLSAYVLVRYLTGAFGIGLIAGLAFGFNPWHLERAAGHLTLTNLQWVPVVILGLILVHRGDVRRPWLPWTILAVGLVLTAYTNTYLALILGVTVVAFIVADLGLAAARRQAGALATAGKRGALVLGMTIATYVPQLIWLLTHRSAVNENLAGTRVEQDLYTYGARWWEWIVPSYRHPAWSDTTMPFLAPRLHSSNFVESSLYLGWTMIAFAAIGAVVVTATKWRRAPLAFPALLAGLMTVLGLILSLPRTVSVLGLSVPTPSRFIWPFFDLWRVYSRAWIAVMLGITVLAAIGLAWIWERLGRLVLRTIAAMVIGVLVVFDLAVGSTTTFDTSPPAVYQALAKREAGARVEYPLEPPTSGAHYQYILYTAGSGRPLVNGAKPGTWSGSLQERLKNPTDPWVTPVLASLGTRWIVVHDNRYTAAGQAPPQPIPGATPTAAFDTDRLLRITAQPATVFAFPGAGFSAGEPVGRHRYEQWLVGPSGTLAVINRTKQRRAITMSFPASSFYRTRTTTIRQGSRVVWQGRIAPRAQRVTVRLTARPGIEQLSVTTKGPADSIAERTGAPDGRAISLRLGGVTVSGPQTRRFTVG